jgi:hypothetical protein
MVMKGQNASARKIARTLDRCCSTIICEVHLNTTESRVYSPKRAGERARELRKAYKRVDPSSATVLSPFRAAKATLARNSGENVRRGRLIEILLGALRLNDQRPIINYRPVSKKRSGSV